jgi:hypothetical protein
MDRLRMLTGTPSHKITENKLKKAQAELKKKGNHIEKLRLQSPGPSKAEKDKLTLNWAQTKRNITELERQHQMNLSKAAVNKREKEAAALQPQIPVNKLRGKSIISPKIRNYNCKCTQKQGGKRKRTRRNKRKSRSRRN